MRRVLLAAAVLLVATAALAEAYPSRPIRMARETAKWQPIVASLDLKTN